MLFSGNVDIAANLSSWWSLAAVFADHLQITTNCSASRLDQEVMWYCAGASKAREQVQHSERSMPLQMAVHNFFVGRGADMPAVHRLAILDQSGDIEHILTQMDILKFMHDRHASDAAASKTLLEAGVPVQLLTHCVPHHISWDLAHFLLQPKLGNAARAPEDKTG